MTLVRLLACLLVAGLAGCARPAPEPPARRFPLTGQVIALAPAQRVLTIHHDSIPGFMDAMTMPFTVKDGGVFSRLQPGDLVRATLVVGDTEAFLEGVERTGTAPLPPPARPSSTEIELLNPGDLVPDGTWTDQDGRATKLSSLSGEPFLLTFIYTRCPLPDFCPRMDRQFAAIQRAIQEQRVRRPVRLVTMSFDPDFDTPAVLKAHAAALGADPATWRFLTGGRAPIEAFGARFGLSVLREADNPADITHNLRTALIDSHFRLVRIYDGSRWTPEQVIADLAALPLS